LGTSNWQQIPFCIDALMKINPTRVLDVGVGFGRWGMVVREFCDVWYARVFKDQWAVHLEGIEAFPRSIADYHRAFYNLIHVGDAAAVIPSLPGPWSVTIYGDVLEHFTKDKAHELLNISLDRSDYVLVNIPIGEEYPQDEAYGNSFERHLSSWVREDFTAFGLVRSVLLKDFLGRPYGSFILSRKDPKDLRSGLFSREAVYTDDPALVSMGDDLERVLARVSEQNFELGFIKNSASYRLSRKLRSLPLLKSAAGLVRGTANNLEIRAVGRKSGSSQGNELWLMGISNEAGETAVPWDFIKATGKFEQRDLAGCPYGKCLVCDGAGEVSIRTGANPLVRFMTHPWSGMVQVTFNGRTELIDLYSAQAGEVVVQPASTPMVPERAAPGGSPRHGTADSPGRGTPGFSQREQEFISVVRLAAPGAIAVHCPRWLGVSSATRGLFDQCYPIPATPEEDPFEVTDDQLWHHAAVLAATGVNRIVVAGGDEMYLRLAGMVRAINPLVVFDLFWLGSYVQVAEDYTWRIMKLWMDAAKAGVIGSIAVAKAGMEEFFRAQGVPSELLFSRVPGTPQAPPLIEDDGVHVGLWISGNSMRKVPHAMIAALSMVQGVRLHAAGLDARAREFVKYLKIPVEMMETAPVSHDQLLPAIRRTHATLYTTFSECCPMLPLESMLVGVPCLIGPVSHLFEDNKYLHDRLVVPAPDRADVIARYLERAVAERDEIMAEYARYIPGYNDRALQSLDRFLSADRSVVRSDQVPALVGEAP